MRHVDDDGSLVSALIGCLSSVFFGKIFGLLSLADITVATILGAAGATGGYFIKKLLDYVVLKFKINNKQNTKKQP